MSRDVPVRPDTRVTVECSARQFRTPTHGGGSPIHCGTIHSIRVSLGATGVAGTLQTAFRSSISMEDRETARLNLALFVAKQPYELDDLREEARPTLVACALPRGQEVCDAYSQAGLVAVGLPVTYPLDSNGTLVPQSRCQSIGVRAKNARLRGVRARSAQDASGAGCELAWFPGSTHSVARRLRTLMFATWFPPNPAA